MSISITPVTSPQTSTFPTTTASPLSIPHFTADDGCLDATNIWYGSRPCDVGTGFSREVAWCSAFFWDYSGGTAAFPTSELATKQCYPGERHAATRCPESYSVVGKTSIGTADDGDSGFGSLETLFCCPEAHNFDVQTSATLENEHGDVATMDETVCIATELAFDGNNPYTLTASSWASDSADAPFLTTKAATFDTDSDLLFASLVTVTYEVIPSLNKTCAPNCETPWTGGEWPMPTEDPLTDDGPESHRGDSTLQGAFKAMIVGITVGGVVALAIIFGVTWCLIKRKKKKQRKAAARGPAAIPTEAQEVTAEEESPHQKTIREPKINPS